jgi:hypothetical protein
LGRKGRRVRKKGVVVVDGVEGKGEEKGEDCEQLISINRYC